MSAIACPKAMAHGPCGGVQADGSCEIGGPCVFVSDDGAALAGAAADWVAEAIGADWDDAAAGGAGAAGLAGDGSSAADDGGLRPERTAAAHELLALMERRPIVVADLPSAGPDVDGERALAAAVAGSVDAVLLGDAPWARVQLPPALRASIVADEGVATWSGMNGRDRNRAALEAELRALHSLGRGAVHCVTGDHPALGHRPDVPGVFDLDGAGIAALAVAQTGLVVSVAESPDAPPVRERAARAAAKARTGADVLFVNHAASVDRVAEFAAEVRSLAPSLRLIACVPLVVSAAGADRLTAFLHGPLPEELAAPLRAADPVAAGVAQAVAHAEALLAIPEIAGVDLSAPAGPGEGLLIAAALAQAGRALGGGS